LKKSDRCYSDLSTLTHSLVVRLTWAFWGLYHCPANGWNITQSHRTCNFTSSVDNVTKNCYQQMRFWALITATGTWMRCTIVTVN